MTDTVSYLCPHCGKPQRSVVLGWKAWGCSEVSLMRTRSGDVMVREFEVDFRDADDWNWDEMGCPTCGNLLSMKEIREGVKRLKKEDNFGGMR
jgi:predicted RNA-binding Zn-ribbon protein involved in translation (DUF1610 family)